MTNGNRLQGQLAALVHHVELSKAGWRERALESMILSTCYISDGALSGEEIAQRLNDQIETPLARAQIESAINRLLSKPQLIRTQNGKLKLPEETRSNIEDNFRQAQSLESDVRDTFSGAFADVDEEYRPSWEDFDADFLSPLISELGARTYEIISAGERTPSTSEAHTRYLKSYPEELRSELSQAISGFLDSSNSAVRRLVLSRLNATFLVQAMGLSESAFQALSEATTRRLKMDVFVDTNFLFSLIGLHENPADDVVEALERLISRTGGRTAVSLYVLPFTLDEARRTLGRYKDRLSGIVLDKTLASAVQQGTSNLSGIALKYIREGRAAESPLSADEYFAPYLDNLVEICRSNGVELYNADTDPLREDQDVIDDLNEEKEYQEERYERGAKPYRIILHDMMLWHFADRKRSGQVESPLKARYWVATLHFGFLRFDRYKRRNSSRSIPVTVHPTVLLQMLQFWVPRSDELEVALIDSIQPILPHEFNAEAEQVTLKILRVLSRFEDVSDLSEETVSNILIDDAVRSHVEATEDIKEQTEVVESALIEQAKQYRERSQKLESQLDEYSKEKEALQSCLDEAEENWSKDRERLKQRLEEEREAKEALGGRLESLEKRLNRREAAEKKRNQRTVFAASSAVIVVATSVIGYLLLSPVIVDSTPLNALLSRASSLVIAVGLTLLGAEAVGSRYESVATWRVYGWLQKARVGLWGAVAAVVLSVLATYVAAVLDIGAL